MDKKELLEKLNKYPDDIELYVYDDDGCTLPLELIEDGMTSHGRGYKGKEKKILKLRPKY